MLAQAGKRMSIALMFDSYPPPHAVHPQLENTMTGTQQPGAGGNRPTDRSQPSSAGDTSKPQAAGGTQRGSDQDQKRRDAQRKGTIMDPPLEPEHDEDDSTASDKTVFDENKTNG